MRISVIGTGYVGLVTGACFAEMGNTVYCVDNDEKKIKGLQKGVMPIYEPGLSDLVIKNHNNKQLIFTTKTQEALENTDICFIAVGTPMDEDGSADLRYVLEVAKTIGEMMVHKMLIVDKSTVPIGTADLVAAEIQKALDKREKQHEFKVVSNPEFLKEGTAIEDTLRPDRVVLGVSDRESEDIMRRLYAPFVHNNDRFVVMDVRSAEMTKYASNAMLATRISFMNEIAALCESVGANITKVRLGMGSDKRIGYRFLYAGCGYGGSCFPKDVQALIKSAKENDLRLSILEKVEQVNHNQKKVLGQKIARHFGDDLTGLTFGIWGLSFKPETDDIRQAPSLVLIEDLISRGASVKVFDPAAMQEARGFLGDSVVYAKEKYSALEGADALVLVTEWKEFRSPNWEKVATKMKQKIIFDGRNVYDHESLASSGFTHYQIGVCTK